MAARRSGRARDEGDASPSQGAAIRHANRDATRRANHLPAVVRRRDNPSSGLGRGRREEQIPWRRQ
jgi:hypothetical protein